MNRTARETLIREWHERVADVEKQNDALAEENALLREYLELAASAKTVSWMTEGRPPACRCDTITERARELIGLHLSEQEGMMLPTGREYQRAVDALAQAIGASHQHPRERAMHQDAARGNFRQEDDGA